jgi:hypothetical protein
MSIKYCRTCSLKDPNQLVCRLTGIPIDLDKDFCSKHATELTTCQICRSVMVEPGFIIDTGDKILHYCSRCHQLLNTCQLCSKAGVCEFETNPDPMPKVVMQTVRQGNMVMQTQAKNEERIKKFCHSCHCWMGDGIDACGKEFNIGCYKKIDNFS